MENHRVGCNRHHRCHADAFILSDGASVCVCVCVVHASWGLFIEDEVRFLKCVINSSAAAEACCHFVVSMLTATFHSQIRRNAFLLLRC